MIEDRVQIHDKYQFEIKLNYKLKLDKKKTIYEVETYLFTPKNIDINKNTYSQKKFYNDIQTYIRLKTPTVHLEHICGAKGSPTAKLDNCLQEILLNQSKHSARDYEIQIKLLCCIIKSALRDHCVLIKNTTLNKDLESLFKTYISSLNIIGTYFKNLHSIIDSSKISNELSTIYTFADEYISLLFEHNTYKVLEILKEQKITKAEEYKPQLLSIIEKEIAYRKKNHYLSLPEEFSDNETLIFRSSVLKKYVENILFLKTYYKKEGTILKQFFLSISAGVAMFFATALAFFLQAQYENLTIPLFTGLIIGYIFKDRLKEILSYFFGNRLNNTLFDHRLEILSNQKNKIGLTKARFRFVKENKVEKKIMHLRNRDHITSIENERLGEKIIFYKKRIIIYSKKFKKLYNDLAIEGITDILRFNISNFLNKMDNPTKPIYIIKNNDYIEITGKRVYHLNMLLKYSFQDQSFYKRFRIVLNRDGIKRIEKVL